MVKHLIIDREKQSNPIFENIEENNENKKKGL